MDSARNWTNLALDNLKSICAESSQSREHLGRICWEKTVICRLRQKSPVTVKIAKQALRWRVVRGICWGHLKHDKIHRQGNSRTTQKHDDVGNPLRSLCCPLESKINSIWYCKVSVRIIHREVFHTWNGKMVLYFTFCAGSGYEIPRLQSFLKFQGFT